jgi:hypothetical protein
VRRVATVLLGLAILSVGVAGCKAKPAAESRRETIWRPLGTWSGHGNVQTESFNGDSGALRIKWSAKHASGEGRFELTIHSAISGRPMGTVVEHSGDGGGTAYFSDDPHVFFAVVDAKDLDWTFTIDEPVDVIVTPK